MPEKSFTFHNLEHSVRDVMAKVREEPMPLFATGVDEIDAQLGGGIAPGELCVIGARPGHGKTLFALQWALEAARKRHGCLFVSEEMQHHELAKRAMRQATGNGENVWRDQWDASFAEMVDYFANRSRVLVLDSGRTIDRIDSAIRQAVDHYGVKFVVVDYLQRIQAKGSSPYERVTEVSLRLKEIALDTSVAIVALAQIAREAEKGETGVPKMYHLRESGQIEQDADVIFFLQWPARIDPQYSDKGEYRANFAKNRNRGIQHPAIEFLRIDPERMMIRGVQLAELPNHVQEFADF